MDINLSDISTSGLMVFVVLITTVFGFIKGMIRMALGFIALLIGSLGAYWGFMRGGPMLNGYFVDPPTWLPAVSGLFVGLGFFLLARTVLGTVLRPIKVIEGKKKNLAGLGGLIGIVTGIVAVAIGMSSVRYLGTVAEIDRLDRAIGKTEIDTQVPVSPLIVAKNFIDASKPGQLHAKIDFVNDRARAQLAKLKVLASEQHAINLSAGTNRTMYDALSQKDIQWLLASTADLELTYMRDKSWGHLLDSERLRRVANLAEAHDLLVLAEIEESLGIAPKPLFPKSKKSDEDKEESKQTAKK